jgi:hypothetical protein
MEALLNQFGPMGLWGLALLALPVAFGGLILRGRARQRAQRLAAAEWARRPLGDVAAGPVTVEGVWRSGGRCVGVLEDEAGRRVAVKLPEGQPEPAAGARLVVVGDVAQQVDDPRPAGYRAGGKLWLIEVAPNALIADGGAGLARAARRASLGSLLGATLFALGLASAVVFSVVALRAQKDVGNLYETAVD